MAPTSGQEDFDIARWPIAEMLDREPYRFEFFQAVRLLERMYSKRGVPGRFNNPREEVARFGANTSVAFPASQIQELDRSVTPPRMTVNFMGLTGPMGELPLPYSALMKERLRERDLSMRDFFDIFNHRAISLFYQAFEKYRFTISYERGERESFSRHILALIGLATPGLQRRLESRGIPDDSLLFYSGLMSLHTRSAESLRQVLIDYFRVPVEIEQFVGVWRPVEPDAQCELGEEGAYSEQLGFGTVVGDEVWDQQSRIRIRLGPLTLDQYMDFLPPGDDPGEGSEAYHRIRAIAGFFAGTEYDMELQLVLKRDDVPRCELTSQGPQLGWTSWVKSAEFGRDPGDAILEL